MQQMAGRGERRLMLNGGNNCRDLSGNLLKKLNIRWWPRGLRHVVIDNNHIEDVIDKAICHHSGLQVFSARGNRLSGGIPPCSFANLTHFDCSDNHLAGTLPVALCRSPFLSWFSFNGNQLSGTIPGCLGQLQWLEWVYLEGNRLSGSLPPALCGASRLKHLAASGNMLGQQLPPCLLVHEQLVELDLRNNALEGMLPTSGVYSALRLLDLGENRLTGAVPETLSHAALNLTTLSLEFNQLSCQLPAELWDWPRSNRNATVSVLGGNYFSCPHAFPSAAWHSSQYALYKQDTHNFYYRCDFSERWVYLSLMTVGLIVGVVTSAKLWRQGASRPFHAMEAWEWTRVWRWGRRQDDQAMESSDAARVTRMAQLVLRGIFWCNCMVCFFSTTVMSTLYASARSRVQCQSWYERISMIGKDVHHNDRLFAILWLSVSAMAVALYAWSHWVGPSPASRRHADRAAAGKQLLDHLLQDSPEETASEPSASDEGPAPQAMCSVQEGGVASSIVWRYVLSGVLALVMMLPFDFGYIRLQMVLRRRGAIGWLEKLPQLQLLGRSVLICLRFLVTICARKLSLVITELIHTASRDPAMQAKTKVFVHTIVNSVTTVITPVATALLVDERCLGQYLYWKPGLEEHVIHDTVNPYCVLPQAGGVPAAENVTQRACCSAPGIDPSLHAVCEAWRPGNFTVAYKPHPFLLLDDCASAVVELYAPIMMQLLLTTAVILPALVIWLPSLLSRHRAPGSPLPTLDKHIPRYPCMKKTPVTCWSVGLFARGNPLCK
ncbi:hypothetical protein CYMTET_50129 [Cymbomonas tetramitiformis]|uniref:Uncharacterized protein n=1 Tax=Cymbomonas tetramitiformis TaxID=36881 RepID=A0AAE0BQ35_9CHLO|nr:hypothetical protein CYMTET_50129 [Cymbomonas tetramitiformis]